MFMSAYDFCATSGESDDDPFSSFVFEGDFDDESSDVEEYDEFSFPFSYDDLCQKDYDRAVRYCSLIDLGQPYTLFLHHLEDSFSVESRHYLMLMVELHYEILRDLDRTYEEVCIDPSILNEMHDHRLAWDENSFIFHRQVDDLVFRVIVNFCPDVFLFYKKNIHLGTAAEEVEPLSFANIHNIRNDFSSRRGYVPVLSIDDITGVDLYNPVSDYFDRKDGQLKNFHNLLCFVSDYSEGGDTIIIYGSAPGYGLLDVIRLFPDRNFVCVDDYPTYVDRTLSHVVYMSFSTFADLYLGDDALCSAKAIYYDFYDFTLSDIQNYDNATALISSLDPVVYNLKNFVSPSGAIKHRVGSILRPQIFSSTTSLEIREIGSYDPGCLFTFSHYSGKMEYYNQVLRTKITGGSELTGCRCYDCGAFDYSLRCVSFQSGVPLSKLLMSVKNVKEFVGYSPDTLGNDLQSLFSLGKFKKKEFGLSDCRGLTFSESVLPALLLRSETGFVNGEARYSNVIHRDPVLACFPGDDKMILPKVVVTGTGKGRNYYKISGKDREFTDDDRRRGCCCPYCEVPSTTTPLSCRDYFAMFRPSAYSCEHCGIDVPIVYNSID